MVNTTLPSELFVVLSRLFNTDLWQQMFHILEKEVTMFTSPQSGNILLSHVNQRSSQKENQMRAISYFKAILQNLTFEAFPIHWALVQIQLGAAHYVNMAGGKEVNQEKAIAYCNTSLIVFKRDKFPEQWAAVQYLLGEIYRNRITGERKANLEYALECCQQALQVRTCDAFLIEWAMTQVLSGLIYVELGTMMNEAEEVYERALECYQQAELVFVEDTFPLQWAIIQQGLCSVYTMRKVGDKGTNLQQAIARGQSSLRVLTREAYPPEWAATHTHLAEAYLQSTTCADLCELYSGRSIMQEQALRHLEAALQIYTLHGYPLEWAKAQRCLGMLYLERVLGKPDDNLEQARESFEAVLQVFHRDFSPLDWASTQALLGTVFLALEEERKENIEKAIACYQASLEVYSSANYPTQWAMNQFNLSHAYELIKNLELP